MNPITKHIIFTAFFISLTVSKSMAQYKAIELNAGFSRYLDDNLDREFEYTYWNIQGLNQFNIGYSFPISKNFLFTPKVGIALAKERYSLVLDVLSSPINDGDFGIVRNKDLQFVKAGLEGSYWLNQNFAGLFFSGELTSYLNTKAETEMLTQTYNATSMGFNNISKSESIKDQVQSIIPVFKIGVGYNLNFFKRLNFFANMSLEYRPTGYYKKTQQVTHISRTLNLGIKYVIEGGTTFLKQLDKKKLDN